MKLCPRTCLLAIFAFSTILLFTSCEEEITTIGEGVAPSEPFSTGVVEYDVFAYNKRINAVQTNQLPLYQVGYFNDPIYGRTEASITTQIALSATNPIFGDFSQATEDIALTDDNEDTVEENEKVTKVVLYFPYQLVPNTLNDADSDGVQRNVDIDDDDPDSDTDGDGISDITETTQGSDPLDSDSTGEEDDFIQNNFASRFALDSIFFENPTGTKTFADFPFDFKVEQSTYFLRDLDPNSGFLENQEYYSNEDVFAQFVGETIVNEEDIVISDEEYLVFGTEDDEDTEVDETTIIESRQNPGIRIELDSITGQFFQENIIDKEGSSELLSQANFQNFLRGLRLSLTPKAEDILLLLDLSQASITITYEYDNVVTEDTDAGEDIKTTERTERDFTLNFLQVSTTAVAGNAVNTILNPNFPATISSTLDTDENASRIYLKGGPGVYSQLRLFAEDDAEGDNIINQIKANNWIINEASLEFYVDEDELTANNFDPSFEAPRLYLYNSETGFPLYNIFTENSDSETTLGRYLNYDGILERNSEGKGEKYTVRITEYLNDIIVRDSLNHPLNLTVSSDITQSGLQEAMGADMSTIPELPVMSAINPLGTVLFGSNVPAENEAKKLKLRVYYTEAN